MFFPKHAPLRSAKTLLANLQMYHLKLEEVKKHQAEQILWAW